jgi:hypothetical protein
MRLIYFHGCAQSALGFLKGKEHQEALSTFEMTLASREQGLVSLTLWRQLWFTACGSGPGRAALR